MPSSPLTPTRRRHSTSIDLSLVSTSPQSNGYNSQANRFSPRMLAHSRRTSLYSIPSPSAPRPVSLHVRRGSLGAVSDFGGIIDHVDGLGNLADELAEAWDEDGEGEQEDSGSGLRIDRGGILFNGDTTASQFLNQCDSPDMASGTKTPPFLSVAPKSSLSAMKHSSRQKHSQNKSQYDGPDYLDEFDLEDVASIPSSLEARIATIESLARWGTESSCNDADMIVRQVAESLKDLGSQSSLENGAMRLVSPLERQEKMPIADFYPKTHHR